MPALSDAEVAAIVFNETRSLTGPALAEARINIAHAILNAAASKHRFPKMAPTVAKPAPGEDGIWTACVNAASAARNNVMFKRDPTGGAEHFNFRKNSLAGDFQGHKLRTSSGPFLNTYPTVDLPSSGIYANTYD